MRYELMKTPDGYMVHDTNTGEYICDGTGDNLFDSYSYAEDLMNTHNNEVMHEVSYDCKDPDGKADEMTSAELYKILDNPKLKLNWDLVEIFEGVRVISFQIDEETDEEQNDE